MRRILTTATVMAAVLGMAGGVAALVVSALDAGDIEPTSSIVLLTIGLLVATIVAGRMPMRAGHGGPVILLDRVPLLLAVVLLPASIAVLLASLAATIELLWKPWTSGWRGAFRFAHVVTTTGLSVLVASFVVDQLDVGTVVKLLPALVAAMALELMLGVNHDIELALDQRERIGERWDRLQSEAASIALSATAVAVLTPYAHEPGAMLALLTGILLALSGVQRVMQVRSVHDESDDAPASSPEIDLHDSGAELSVLFCDIRGITSWADDRSATDVISELNVLLVELSASVSATGGTLDRFTGDGLMAFWGAPVTIDDHADRAGRTALDMLDRLDSINEHRREENREPFSIGIAVHSGSVLGETASMTARLEASTKELDAALLVSRDTVDLLGSELRSFAMHVGDVMISGRPHPVEAWALQPLEPEQDDIDDEFAA
jgi:class 3 adenylate cyclase